MPSSEQNRTKRNLYQPYSGGVRTSVNTPVAKSEFAINNALNTVLYKDSLDNGVWKLIERESPQLIPGTLDLSKKVKPGTLGFVLYDDPTNITEGYIPTISNESESYDVFYFTPDKKFNDGLKHQCLGIMYNGRRLKIKFAGQNKETGLPFFYVEDAIFEKNKGQWTGEQTRWYGVFTDKSPEQTVSFGKSAKRSIKDGTPESFAFLSSVNNDIKYLKSI